MNAAKEARTPAGADDRTKWWAMLCVALSVLMGTVDMSIVNISLPTLARIFRTDFAVVQWVILAYVLLLSCLLLVFARLGDMVSKRTIFAVGVVVFTAGSLLCGLSPSVGWLIASRAVQGVGAAMTQAVGLAIVTQVFPASERGRALGIIGAVVSIGIALGPAVGGLLIGGIGWRSIFLVNVPIGGLTLALIPRYIPVLTPAGPGQRFDLPGAAIFLVFMTGYALGMTAGQKFGFADARALWLLGLALAGLMAFLAVEARSDQPMLDFSLFKNLLFSINLVMGWLVFIVLAGGFIIPFFLQLVTGYSISQVGLLMMSGPILMGLVAPWAGRLSDRFGSRLISLLGLLAVIGGCLAMSTIHPGVRWLGFLVRSLPLGLGLGMFQAPNNSAVMGAAPRNRLGLASGLLAFTRTTGNTTGIPLVGAIFTAHLAGLAGAVDRTRLEGLPPAVLAGGVAGTYRTTAFIVLGATVLAALALIIDARQKKARRPARP